MFSQKHTMGLLGGTPFREGDVVSNCQQHEKTLWPLITLKHVLLNVKKKIASRLYDESDTIFCLSVTLMELED